MEYFIEKKIPKQIKTLYQSGGHYQKAAEKVKSIIGAINRNESDPLNGIRKTKYGESRIKHCVKYDLEEFEIVPFLSPFLINELRHEAVKNKTIRTELELPF